MSADLRRIADRQDIAMLIARIARLADTGTPESYLALFAEDAVWDLTDSTDLPLDTQRIQGHAALLAGVHARREAGIQGPGSHTRHDVSSIVVTVDGDTAHADSYFRYYRNTDGVPSLIAIGSYSDTFTRGSTGWLLQHRVIGRG